MKVTTPTDTASLAVLDVQCHGQWRHDTKTGPQVVRRNADDLHTVAADNGFQNWHSEYGFYSLSVEPLIHYRDRLRMLSATMPLFEHATTPSVVCRNVVLVCEALVRRYRASASLVSRGP